MKKYFTVLLCTIVFLFNDISPANTTIFAKAKKEEEKVVVEQKQETKEEEKEEEKQEEPEASVPVEAPTTNEYVEETETYTETQSENYGTYGRLYVSWYDVALYDYNVYQQSSSSLQELVDNYDSAAFYANRGRIVIADHDYQGFGVLTSLSEGSTAYIKLADGNTFTFRLIKKEKGYNTGPDLVDTAGNSFYDMDSNLIMYTCYDGGIMVTLWVLA